VFALERWRSFWARLFGSSRGSVRQRKVLEYIVHRTDEGARLEEIVQEEYVRRQAAPAEVERILSHPELVEAAREGIRKSPSPITGPRNRLA
jgi:gamma-glutamyltranspeptidase